MTQTDPAICLDSPPIEPVLIQFAAGLAHDLSNALNSVGLHADMAKLMLERGETDNARRMLDGMQNEFRRNIDLMNALRRFANVPNAVAVEPVELSAVLAEARDCACLLLDADPAAILISDTGTVGPVALDREAMNFVFVQIIRNALEAGATRIDIAVDGSPRQWRLSIRDNGQGIDAGVRPKLFDMFASTRREQGHLGLGLWVVGRLCAAHGLSIDAQWHADGGTVFVLEAAASRKAAD